MDLPLNMVIFQPVMLPCRGGEPSDLQLVGIKFGHGLKLCSDVDFAGTLYKKGPPNYYKWIYP